MVINAMHNFIDLMMMSTNIFSPEQSAKDTQFTTMSDKSKLQIRQIGRLGPLHICHFTWKITEVII